MRVSPTTPPTRRRISPSTPSVTDAMASMTIKPPDAPQKDDHGLCFQFVRVTPRATDFECIHRVFNLLAPCGAYDSVSHTSREGTTKVYLDGFFFFSSGQSLSFIKELLPHFFVDFVKDLRRLESKLKKSPTSVWYKIIPLKKVKRKLFHGPTNTTAVGTRET